MQMAEDGGAVRFCADVVPNFSEAGRALVAVVFLVAVADVGDVVRVS